MKVSMTIHEPIETVYPGLVVRVVYQAECEVNGDEVEIKKLKAGSACFEGGEEGCDLKIFDSETTNREQQRFLGIVREKAREVAYQKLIK